MRTRPIHRRSRAAIASLCLLVAVSLSSCFDSCVPHPCCGPTRLTGVTQYGSVAVTLLDSVSGRPVPYASIMLGPTHLDWSATATNGVAILTDVVAGPRRGIFTAAGYEDDTTTLVVQPGDQTLTVFMHPSPAAADTVPPRLLGAEFCSPDTVTLLFSERMDAASVEAAIAVQWEAPSPCTNSARDSLLSLHSVTWKSENMVTVYCPWPTRTVFCFNDPSNPAGGGEFEQSYWTLWSFQLGATAKDHAGNLLRRGWQYP